MKRLFILFSCIAFGLPSYCQIKVDSTHSTDQSFAQFGPQIAHWGIYFSPAETYNKGANVGPNYHYPWVPVQDTTLNKPQHAAVGYSTGIEYESSEFAKRFYVTAGLSVSEYGYSNDFTALKYRHSSPDMYLGDTIYQHRLISVTPTFSLHFIFLQNTKNRLSVSAGASIGTLAGINLQSESFDYFPRILNKFATFSMGYLHSLSADLNVNLEPYYTLELNSTQAGRKLAGGGIKTEILITSNGLKHIADGTKDTNHALTLKHHSGFYIIPAVCKNIGTPALPQLDNSYATFLPSPPPYTYSIPYYVDTKESAGPAFAVGYEYRSKELIRHLYTSWGIQLMYLYYSGTTSVENHNYLQTSYKDSLISISGIVGTDSYSFNIFTLDIPIEIYYALLESKNNMLSLGFGVSLGTYIEQVNSSQYDPNDPNFKGMNSYLICSVNYETSTLYEGQFKVGPILSYGLNQDPAGRRMGYIGLKITCLPW